MFSLECGLLGDRWFMWSFWTMCGPSDGVVVVLVFLIRSVERCIWGMQGLPTIVPPTMVPAVHLLLGLLVARHAQLWCFGGAWRISGRTPVVIWGNWWTTVEPKNHEKPNKQLCSFNERLWIHEKGFRLIRPLLRSYALMPSRLICTRTHTHTQTHPPIHSSSKFFAQVFLVDSKPK